MNLFDLTGPEFLALYLPLAAIVIGVAAMWRWQLRLPASEPSPEALDLSPYEVAYLAGNEELAVNAALTRLVRHKALAVNAVSGQCTVSVCGELPPDADPLEQSLHDLAREEEAGRSIKAVREEAGLHLLPTRGRLQDLGLLLSDDQAIRARWLPTLLVLSLVGLGLVKLGIGMERHKPVGFLGFTCIVTTLIAFFGFGRRPFRSRQGDIALKRLKKQHAALEVTARRNGETLVGFDLALAVALFGLGVLADGPLADLQKTLTPPSGSGGGCGGGSCGGGGCGGGCGGCS